MQKTPKKVFIIKNGRYIELSYDKFRDIQNADEKRQERKYILIQGMLLEVPESEYRSFYRDCRRQRYLQEQEQKNHVFSVDEVSDEDFNGENILISPEPDILEALIWREEVERLHQSIAMLTLEEKRLIWQYFFCNVSQDKLAEIYGVNQSSISRKINKIIEKMKKIYKI